jgi:TrmH family RNA methyltransferase
MTPITSLQNPKVKYVLSLRERRERQQHRLVLVEGYAELSLVLANGIQPVDLFICPPLFRQKKQAALLRQFPAVQPIEVDERVFQKIAYRENPDGWLATVPFPQIPLEKLPLRENPCLVIAERMEKPGNLGAILRTADAAGMDAVIACDPLTDWGNPNVVRASKGTLFTLPISEGSYEEVRGWLTHQGIRAVVATPDASLSHTQADFSGGVALILGTEHEGVSSRWLKSADVQVSIPMFGKVNSLNVSAAAAILMYEVVRQRASGRK